MSYFHGGPEDYVCDFPNCEDDYDCRPGWPIAVIKGIEIFLFCAKHCQKLIEEGIELMSLDEVLDRTEAEARSPKSSEEKEIEREFIAKLKG